VTPGSSILLTNFSEEAPKRASEGAAGERRLRRNGRSDLELDRATFESSASPRFGFRVACKS